MLIAALLTGACTARPSTLILEAAQAAPWQTPPKRLLVALSESASDYASPIQLGAALRRELAACGIDADVVTEPAASPTSLEPDGMERVIEQSLRRSRPDGLLLVVPQSVNIRSAGLGGEATTTYSIRLTELASRKAILRAVAQFKLVARAEAEMPNLGRLLVREMSSAGAFRCPGQRA